MKKYVFVVVVVALLSGCNVLPPQPQPRMSEPVEVRTQNVQIYCDTVSKTGGKHDVMIKEEGHLNDEIGYYGIPQVVIDAHRNYFKEFESKTTVQLGQDYLRILEACRATGAWVLPSERNSSHS